jgi:hypothetical protein
MEQIKHKYREAVSDKFRIEIKYAKLKSYVVRQECEHQAKYRELSKEI